MLRKSTSILAAAMLTFGASVSAQAGNDNTSDSHGGFAWGPFGQMMGDDAVNPAYHRSLGGRRDGVHVAPDIASGPPGSAYAYVPSWRYRHHGDF